MTFMADHGKVTVLRSDFAFDHLQHSFAAGLTRYEPEAFLWSR